MSQTGEVLTESLSQQSLELLQKAEELFASDTPETAERTLSEFTEMARSHTLTTFDLRRTLNSIYDSLGKPGTQANMVALAANIIAEANQLPYRYHIEPYGLKRWRIWAYLV